MVTFFLIFIPLMSDISFDDSLLSKSLVCVPFVLVILGKLITIREKMNSNKSYAGDVGMNIGLILALALFLLS